MILLFQPTGWPWWVNVISGGGILIAGIAAGIVGALPWRTAAEAAKSALTSKDSELQSVRSQRNEAQEAVAKKDIDLALIKKDLEICNAKTNFTQFRSTVEAMFTATQQQIVDTQTLMLAEIAKQTEALEDHSKQDAVTAEETLKQLIALNDKTLK